MERKTLEPSSQEHNAYAMNTCVTDATDQLQLCVYTAPSDFGHAITIHRANCDDCSVIPIIFASRLAPSVFGHAMTIHCARCDDFLVIAIIFASKLARQ